MDVKQYILYRYNVLKQYILQNKENYSTINNFNKRNITTLSFSNNVTTQNCYVQEINNAISIYRSIKMSNFGKHRMLFRNSRLCYDYRAASCN